MYLFFVTALIPLVVGALWYGPLFGKKWMRTNGFTPASLEGANMAVIFGLTYLFGIFLSYVLLQLTVHQTGMYGVLAADPQFSVEGSDLRLYYQDFMARFGEQHRTFGHGALHGGFVAGIGFALPVIAVISLFERRGWSYIGIHAGYWIVTLAVMGGVICGFMPPLS